MCDLPKRLNGSKKIQRVERHEVCLIFLEKGPPRLLGVHARGDGRGHVHLRRRVLGPRAAEPLDAPPGGQRRVRRAPGRAETIAGIERFIHAKLKYHHFEFTLN